MRENAGFAVFLIQKSLFRRTYPEPVPEAIVFSPSAAAWPTVILSHVCQPRHRQRFVDLNTGDPMLESSQIIFIQQLH
jgi:hypothetical protein